MNKLLLIIAVLAGSVSCRCPEKTTSASSGSTTVADTAQSLQTENRMQTDDILAQPQHRLVVSFISIGEGTFPQARGMMDNYIKSFEEKNKVDIEFASKPWGREGESDHYFTLKGLTPEQENEFVAGMKEVFAGNKLIIIDENRPNKNIK